MVVQDRDPTSPHSPSLQRGLRGSQMPKSGHRGQGQQCPPLPRGLPVSLPPSPPALMANEALKLSCSLVRVTDATVAPRTRYCVSLVRQRLCMEAKDAPRPWVKHHSAGYPNEPPTPPLWSPLVTQSAVAQ